MGECQPFVVNAQQVQDCGIELVHMDRVFDDVIAVVICFAEGEALFYSSASKKHAEAAGVMITAIIGLA